MGSLGALNNDTLSTIKCQEVVTGKAWLLHNVLSAAECKTIIGSANGLGYDLKKSGTRFCLRLVEDDPKLAQVLFDRLSPYFATMGIDDYVDIDAELEWKACALNPGFRVCQYKAGHQFGRHLDYGVSKTWIVPSQRSWYTVMFYLNDAAEFEGGHTVFYKSEQSKEVTLDVAPEAGLAIVFLQDDASLYHDGGVLLSGTKYILRTELMYVKHVEEETKDEAQEQDKLDQGTDTVDAELAAELEAAGLQQ